MGEKKMGETSKIIYNTIYGYLEESQCEKLNNEDILCINMIEADTSEFINNLGVRSRLKGYKYLKESICVELLRDTKYEIKDENTIIKTIATKNHTEKANIERSMRYAIQDLKKNKDYKELNEIIGRDIFSKYEIPTNLELIFCAVEKIRESKNRKRIFDLEIY